MNWQDKRTMTGDEYTAVLHRMKLTWAAAGRYLDVSERTSRRYAHGQQNVPTPVVLLLRALLAHDERPRLP